MLLTKKKKKKKKKKKGNKKMKIKKIKYHIYNILLYTNIYIFII